MSAPGLAKALVKVKNMTMDENTMQWLLDHMSPERQERYRKSIEEAHRKGVEEGLEEARRRGVKEGAERAVAMLLWKGLVTREAACLVLGVSDSDLDAVLEKYQDAR